MNVEKGEVLVIENVKEFIKQKRNLYWGFTEEELEDYARQFVTINNNLLQGKGVYAMQEGWPNFKKSATEYFSIIYVDDGEIKRVYMPELSAWIGAMRNFKNYRLPSFCFQSSSNTIPRWHDATDKFFKFLQSMGGCYAKINRI